MNREQTLKRLDIISEMTDQEIANNAKWIRETSMAAHMHINVLRRNFNNEKRLKKVSHE